MMTRKFNKLLWIGVAGTFIIGTSFFTDVYRAFRGDQKIWWTHQTMRLTVDQTKDNVELYIGGEPLQKHLSDGTLFSVDKNGKLSPVTAKDITVRLNNWDKTKASILAHTTMSGFALGITITLLVTGLIQMFHQGKNEQTET